VQRATALPSVVVPVAAVNFAGVNTHRTDSFRALFARDSLQRQLFRDDFLVETFSITGNKAMFAMIMSCVYDARVNANDNDVYEALCTRIKESQSSPVAQLMLLIANIRQLSAQVCWCIFH
jgi:hypothetical protein